MRHVAVYALMFFAGTFCKGQNKTESLKQEINSETKGIAASEGPKTISRTIVQDKKGNIWIASWQGVFRYDRKSFTHVTRDVSSARFFSALEDSKGNLWFGTIGSGVYYYDGKSFQNFTTREGLFNNEIVFIYEDKAGNIWFGANGGASRYDGKSFRNFLINEDSIIEDRTGKTIPDFTRPPNEVNSIIEDKTGKFWFGTRGKVFTFDGKKFTTLAYQEKSFSNVRSIIEDKKGNIWLGGNDGLWRYDGKTFTNFTQNFVGYIYEDRIGNLWISSASANNQGWALSRYDAKSLYNNSFVTGAILKPTLTEIKSNEAMIFGIVEAYDGSIWFGTPNGVYRYDGNSFTKY